MTDLSSQISLLDGYPDVSIHTEEESLNNKLYYVVVFYIVALFLLNAGLMVITLPGPIPLTLSEIFLGIMFLMTDCVSKFIKGMQYYLFILLVIFWMYSATRIIMCIPEYGVWAIRDGTQYLNSLYIIIGFAYACDKKRTQYLIDHVKTITSFFLIYLAVAPIGRTTQGFLPTIVSPSGQTIPIFFNTHTAFAIGVWSYFALALSPNFWKLSQRHKKFLSIVYLPFLYVTNTARTFITTLVAGFVFLKFVTKIEVSRLILFSLIFGVTVLLIIQVTGIQIEMRYGEPLSFKYIFGHILSIFGIETDGFTEATGGSGQRIEWWKTIFGHLRESWTNMLFGLGFGIPLTDLFVGQGIPVREPHNSFMSVIARLGVVGLVLYFSMMAYFLRSYIKVMQHYKNSPEVYNFTALVGLFFLIIFVTTMAEPFLEMPFIAVPFYFFIGVILGMGYHIRKESLPVVNVV